VTNKESDLIRADILQAIKSRSDSLLGRTKAGALGRKLLDRLRTDDLTDDLLMTLDCSEILETFCAIQSMKVSDYIRRYVETAGSMESLEDVFDRRLVSAVSPE
jgi:hypothetical protein